jgi:hypothetical protein
MPDVIFPRHNKASVIAFLGKEACTVRRLQCTFRVSKANVPKIRAHSYISIFLTQAVRKESAGYNYRILTDWPSLLSAPQSLS